MSANEIEQELRFALDYWKEMQPQIRGRYLNLLEWYVAHHAHQQLSDAIKQAQANNVSLQIIAPLKDDFQVPKALCRDDSLRPELLAQIAAPLLPERDRTPSECIRLAHDLFLEAQRHIEALPKEQPGFIQIHQMANLPVSFAEILHSNNPKSGQLPLLPPAQRKRNAGISGSPLSADAIRAAIKRLWPERTDFDPIPLLDLCVLRYHRFKRFHQSQRLAAKNRGLRKKKRG